MPECRQLGRVFQGKVIQLFPQYPQYAVAGRKDLAKVGGVPGRCFDNATGTGIDDGSHTTGLSIKDVVLHTVSG